MQSAAKPQLNSILMVDDDTFTNLLHSEILHTAGVDAPIDIAKNGREALDYLHQHPPSFTGNGSPGHRLLLLDINMPLMDGWEFLEHYKNLDEIQKANTHVIILTTSFLPADRKRAEANPDVADFLIKPLTIDAIRTIMREYFE